MMKKVAVITDSVASLPPDLVKRNGLSILPLNIYFAGKKYRDGIDLSAGEAYRMLEEKPDQFFSSPASIGEYLDIFKNLATEAESILCITLSSKLSGMRNVAELAVKQAREDSLKIPIDVLDSLSATVGEGIIVSAAAGAASANKNLAEVKQIARATRDKVEVIGIMQTIRNVYRTGRIPKLAARFGSMLNIRPVFTISGGGVKVTGIIKTQENGIDRILKQMREKIHKRPVHVGIAHADAPEEGEKLRAKIKSEFNCVELWLTDFSPIMAYATGAGVLVVAYYEEF